MKINKQSGLPLQIYIPNLQTIQPFEFEFYTNPTAPKTTNIVVRYDGTTYFDCAPWEKGVYLYTEKKLPNDGQLLCRATYYIPSPVVPGGLQKIVMGDISTGISIVSQGGNYFDPIADPSKLKTPSFNDPTCSHIPIFMTFYPGAEKGESGKDGAIGMDYSKLEEQIVPGEFWRSKNGSRKQVYTRTFVTDSKVATGLYGTYASGFSMTGVEVILDVKGVILNEPPNGGASTYQPIDRPVFYDIIKTNITMFMPDFSAFENGNMGCNILVVGPDRTQLNDHRLLMTVAVKYIKK